MMDGMIAMEQKINEAALDMISYVFEEHSGLIEEIRISLRSGDLRGTKKGMFALLLKVVKYSMPDCDTKG